MSVVFADAFYFYALLNPRDAAHARASAFSCSYRGRLVTTTWVLTELADGLCAPSDRVSFVRLLDDFAGDPLNYLFAPSLEIFRAGTDLFRARPDKSWSLTDCVSFVVMQRMGITDALTGDRHFVQAGFHALLAEAP